MQRIGLILAFCLSACIQSSEGGSAAKKKVITCNDNADCPEGWICYKTAATLPGQCVAPLDDGGLR